MKQPILTTSYLANWRELKKNGFHIIDITYKHDDKNVLAPTKELVYSRKFGDFSFEKFKQGYLALLEERFKRNKISFQALLNLAEFKFEKESLNTAICCFCKEKEQCHRNLALQFLKEKLLTGELTFEGSLSEE